MGRKILVVEDEYFIAQEIAHTLAGLGAEVVGPLADRSSAMAAIEADGIDFAVLDINLRGEMAFDLARLAASEGIVVVFATGYEVGTLPADLQSIPFWTKPFDVEALAAALAALPRD